MKQQKLTSTPNDFDGAKFSARYGLAGEDFHVKSGILYYPDHLPDDAADFGGADAPDAEEVRPGTAIAAVKAGTATLSQMCATLAWLLDRLGR